MDPSLLRGEGRFATIVKLMRRDAFDFQDHQLARKLTESILMSGILGGSLTSIEYRFLSKIANVGDDVDTTEERKKRDAQKTIK